MATVSTLSVPSAGSDDAKPRFQHWLDAFGEVIEQLNKGVAAPTVDLNKIVDEGYLKGIVNWKETLGLVKVIGH